VLRRNFPRSLGAKGGQAHLNNEERWAIWLKEINDAIRFEHAYLRVKVKDKQYD